MNLQNKHILLLIERGTLAGAERQAIGLARYLSHERNCKVDLLLTSSNNRTKEFNDYVQHSGINKIFYFGEPYLVFTREFSIKNLKRIKWSFQYILRLKRGLRGNKYEALIPFLNTPSKIAFYLYKLLPSAKYTFWHQLGLDTWKFDLAESIAIRNVPKIIGNAENCFDIFIEKYNINRNTLHLLPQYTTLAFESLSQKELRSKYNIPENVVVYGMISHFRTFKYHKLALKVFSKLKELRQDVYLILLGNAENDQQAASIFDEIKTEIKLNNIKDVLLLSDENVVHILNVLNVGLLFSLTEGTPNVVMEYMLYGLPVIASDHSGCIGLLERKDFLIEQNSENQILQAMITLCDSEILRKQEGEINKTLIKRYDIENYVCKLENILTIRA